MQFGRRRRFGLACVGQQQGGARLALGRLGGDAGGVRHLAFDLGEQGGGALGVLHGAQPAQQEQCALGAPDMAAQVAIARRLARLLAQRLQLGFQRDQHVVKPGEIGLGRLEAKLGFVAARMEPGDPGGLFQQMAPLGRLGGDHRTHLALAHQRGRARARRGVGEQQLHVARTHVAAVDAVERAFAAFDAAAYFQFLELVKLGGRAAGRVVQRQRHFADVAGRAAAGAVEDHVVHAAAAHLLGRGFAHHPAQRLDQVGLAAAVGPDNAGHAGFDNEFGRIDERLETDQTQLGEVQHDGLRPFRARTGRRQVELIISRRRPGRRRSPP